MTDEEITSMRISKANRNWLEELKRKWGKGNLNAVVTHLKHYYEVSASDIDKIMKAVK